MIVLDRSSVRGIEDHSISETDLLLSQETDLLLSRETDLLLSRVLNLAYYHIFRTNLFSTSLSLLKKCSQPGAPTLDLSLS